MHKNNKNKNNNNYYCNSSSSNGNGLLKKKQQQQQQRRADKSMPKNGSVSSSSALPAAGRSTVVDSASEQWSWSFPEKADVPDCAYFMRTGTCAYGSNCKFNHPPYLKRAILGKANLPERVGQPDCQYYMKTGMCKFGASCKYHHPRYRNGSGGQTPVNYLGFPIRQGEKECAYYMRTGSCKYGINCKFHHPQPTTIGVVPVSSYGTPQSPSTPVSSYSPGMMSWPLTRPPYVPSPRIQGSPAYLPVYIPPSQAMVPMTTWTNAQGPLSPFLSPESHQQVFGTGHAHNSAHTSDVSSNVMKGSSTLNLPSHGGTTTGFPPEIQSSNGQKDVFPERHGQPECQYYMKTGDCKFGTACKYHHPKEKVSHLPACCLSPMGLPLRPDQPACMFYSRFGVCKFGPTCKFDHPMAGFNYSSSIPSFSERPTYQYINNSLTTTPVQSSYGYSQVLSVEKGQQQTTGDSAAVNNNPSLDGPASSKQVDTKTSGADVSESR